MSRCSLWGFPLRSVLSCLGWLSNSSHWFRPFHFERANRPWIQVICTLSSSHAVLSLIREPSTLFFWLSKSSRRCHSPSSLWGTKVLILRRDSSTILWGPSKKLSDSFCPDEPGEWSRSECRDSTLRILATSSDTGEVIPPLKRGQSDGRLTARRLKPPSRLD